MRYTVKDICEHFRVAESTVLHWIATKQLKAMNIGMDPGKGKPRWRITQAALDAFEEARTAESARPRGQRAPVRRSKTVKFFK